MNDKILFVDDDANLFAGCQRTLKREFTIDTAESGKAGLTALAERGPYSVVVADRQMPHMDGIEFLTQVKKQAPDTIRMMLTGNADLEGAIRVVNDGNIFRFLTKPCPTEVLSKALRDAQTQYHLVTAEKELLERTLSGSVKLLTDILALVETQSFGRTQILRDAIASVTHKLRLVNAWEIHLAVMLAPLGYVTIPPETLVKSRASKPLSAEEDQMLLRVPEIAARLLANIPRLEGVARIVRYQQKRFDGSGFPAEAIAGDLIPQGSRLLKILLDMLDLQAEGLTRAEALERMHHREGWYDPTQLATVRACTEGGPAAPFQAARPSVPVAFKDLESGMVLRSNVQTRDGLLILSAGHRITEITMEKLRNFHRIAGLQEPILVEKQADQASPFPVQGAERLARRLGTTWLGFRHETHFINDLLSLGRLYKLNKFESLRSFRALPGI